MKKLTISVDTKNRDLSEIYESSTFVNYYDAPSGSDVVQIPDDASYIEIASAANDVWFKMGDENSFCLVPSGDIEDGTSSRFIPAKGRVLHRIVEETHVSLDSAGGVVVSYWRQ